MNTEQSLLGKRAHTSATARKPTAESDGAVNHASSGDDFSKEAEMKASKKPAAEKPKGSNKRQKNGAEDNLGSENNLEDLSSFNSNDQDDESGNDDAAATN